jgi:hypothetical protein
MPSIINHFKKPFAPAWAREIAPAAETTVVTAPTTTPEETATPMPTPLLVPEPAPTPAESDGSSDGDDDSDIEEPHASPVAPAPAPVAPVLPVAPVAPASKPSPIVVPVAPVIPAPAAVPPYKSAALLFGLNYKSVPGSCLSGCINDIHNTAAFLKGSLRFSEVTAYDDDTAYDQCTALGIIGNLNKLALRSWAESLDLVWIHYSGHGTYVRDDSRDELDGRDECLCPVDYARSGFIRDDDIATLLARFNPRTKVVFISDCCHSGTIGDLKLHWIDRKRPVIENTRTVVAAPVTMISGCNDFQTSADAFIAAPSGGGPQAQGALTNALLRALKEDTDAFCGDVFKLVDRARAILKAGGFAQYPELTSSFDLAVNPMLVPLHALAPL